MAQHPSRCRSTEVIILPLLRRITCYEVGLTIVCCRRTPSFARSTCLLNASWCCPLSLRSWKKSGATPYPGQYYQTSEFRSTGVFFAARCLCWLSSSTEVSSWLACFRRTLLRCFLRCFLTVVMPEERATFHKSWKDGLTEKFGEGGRRCERWECWQRDRR